MCGPTPWNCDPHSASSSKAMYRAPVSNLSSSYEASTTPVASSQSSTLRKGCQVFVPSHTCTVLMMSGSFWGGPGEVRMYTLKTTLAQLTPGQLPGFNVPVSAVGSILLKPGMAAFVLRGTSGTIHYFKTESEVSDTWH
jgi:hypothetical protein